MLRPKKLEIQNVMTVKILKKPQTERRKMEPNPSKERAMHEEDNPNLSLF
jgi:hypothetical protein